MNLLQMKQKMIDLGISESYLAECCGVSTVYLKACLSTGDKMHPMTKKLEQKIEGVFHNLEIRKAKEKRIKPVEEILKPEPSPTMVYGEKSITDEYVTKKQKSPLKQVIENLYEQFGTCEHHVEYTDNGLNISVDISIK